MYIYEKQLGRIKVSKLVPNMEEIKRLKEQEVYGKLDYLTLLRAETSYTNICPLEILLEDREPRNIGMMLNTVIPAFFPGYHSLEKDKYVSEEEVFTALNKIINFPIIKTTKYFDESKDDMCYLALTYPKYVDVAIRGNREVKEMTGIIPISERLYNANELVKLIGEGNLEKLYYSMPEDYFVENPQLIEVKDIFAPSIWFSSINDLYEHNLIDGDIKDVYKKLKISDEILSRVRRK